MTNKIIYSLQDKQKLFSQDTHKYRLFGGARGGGKSYAFRAECIKQLLSAPNVRGLILRRTSPEIKENFLVPFMMEVPKNLYKYNGQENKITLFNDSTLRLSYCRNVKDVVNYQGLEYDFIGIEELTQWNEFEFKMLMTSLRTSRKGIQPNAFFSTNPGGIGHLWVKRLFVDRQFTEYEKPEEYNFIPAKYYDNKYNNKDYIENLNSMPEQLRRAHRDGDWNVFEGQYFTEWNPDVHVVQPFIPTPEKGYNKFIISMDYGYKAPSSVHWMAQDNQKNVIIYRELYIEGMLYADLAKEILRLTPREEKVSACIVDPAVVNKTSESNGTTLKEVFEKECFSNRNISVFGGDNARVKGWNIYRKYLQVNEDPNSKAKTSKLKITSNCHNLIRTLPSLIHDERNVEDLNTNGEDHSADGTRYGLVYFSQSSGTFEEVANIQKETKKTYKEHVWVQNDSEGLLDVKF